MTKKKYEFERSDRGKKAHAGKDPTAKNSFINNQSIKVEKEDLEYLLMEASHCLSMDRIKVLTKKYLGK